MSCCQAYRSQGAIDILSAVFAPSEQPCEKAMQCDQLCALGDQDDVPEPELRAGFERTHGTTHAVEVLNEERQRADHAEQRFLREAQLASQVRHPNAAHVYDFGVAEEDGLLWIAMEFVDGITLADWLETHGPMSLGELVAFFEYLADVVEATHQCGIVHRDLKPSNVMVIESKGLPAPKLLDFGIAKGEVVPLAEDDDDDEEHVDVPGGDQAVTALMRATPSPRRREPTRTAPPPAKGVPAQTRRITRTGAGFGSGPYMSPEQWRNAAGVGSAADIYSLGIMIYEALTGRVPFTATNADDYCRQHCYAPVPGLGGGFSSDLDRVISRALDKRPENRHASVLELAADLRAVLQADPREQIRSLTQRWQERGRSPDLLARGQVLAELERCVQRPRVAAALSDQECLFIKLSQRRAQCVKWGLGGLVVLVAASVLVVRAEVRARTADQIATESEVEQGRQALLHGESSEAVRHLEQAYRRGEHSSGVAFMLARALQPRMSERARFTSSSGRMWSAMFAPDGKRVLTTDDQSARMWDAESGQLLFTMSHGDTVYRAVFSPDGSRIITAGGDGTVRIWSAATGAPPEATRTHSRRARKALPPGARSSRRLWCRPSRSARRRSTHEEINGQARDPSRDAPGARRNGAGPCCRRQRERAGPGASADQGAVKPSDAAADCRPPERPSPGHHEASGSDGEPLRGAIAIVNARLAVGDRERMGSG